MNLKLIRFILLGFCLALMTFIATTGFKNQSSTNSLIISAAASLEPAMEEIKLLYQQNHPQVTLNYNFGASGLLQQQIERGAPVDIFLSASEVELDKLAQKNLIIGASRHHLLRNRIALIVNKNNENIRQISDLTNNQISKITIGDPNVVPAGRYAQQAIDYYQLTDNIKDKLVFAKDEQAVLTYVELGYTDVGFVYVSSTFNNPQIKVIAIADEESHQSINYSVAIIQNTTQLDFSEDFLEFLKSNAVEKIFQKYNFNYLRS